MKRQSKSASSASPPAPTFGYEPLPHHVSKQPYSLLRALESAANANAGRLPSGLEREVSDEIAKRSGRTPKGFFVPIDGLSARALTLSSGAGAVPTLVPEGTFIDTLRAKMVVGLAGGRILSLGGEMGSPVSIPKLTSSATVAWCGEAVAPSTSQMVTTPINLSPKTLAAWTDLTRTMWRSGTPDFEALIIDDMARQISAELDRVALNGSGTSNEPTGLMAWSGVPIVSLGTNGAALTRANLVEAERGIGNANGDAGADTSIAFVATPNARAKMRLTDASTGNAGRWLWADDDYVLNHPAYATNNLRSDLTKGTGTGLSSAVFGDFRSVIVNVFGAIDVVVDKFKWVQAGAVRIVCYQEADVVVTHPEAFRLFKDIVTV